MLGVLIVFTIIIYIEVPGFVKQCFWKELVFFCVLMSIAFVMCVLFVMGVPIISPIRFMEYVVKDVLHLNYK